jgi:hypothetical protein
MALTSLKNDGIEITIRDLQNRRQEAYRLDSDQLYNLDKSRPELGIVGGAGVSTIRGNPVDLESDLFGITRGHSKCATNLYVPQCDMNNNAQPSQRNPDRPACAPSQLTFVDRTTGKRKTIDTRLQHLPASQIIHYNAVPAASPFIGTSHQSYY